MLLPVRIQTDSRAGYHAAATMWGLWLFPLVKLSFFAGFALAVLWYLRRSLAGKRPKVPLAIAVGVVTPFGCAALPVLTLMFLAAIAPLFQKSDTQLYEEVFGHAPPFGEDRMLFNDFGSGTDRHIFMRAEPTPAQRDQMLASAPLRASQFTLDEFAALGTQQGFMWWLSTDPLRGEHCKSVRIREGHGFRGWREFRVAECLDSHTDMYMRYVYVMAAGRR
ncbi:MAG: hypothetical protein M3Q69_02465 [Acidobacteriota bacterium]|nr:hypothetical protein [Acidobacteriota bacterium]